MGCGTGTGGAPIIAKICKELGILTVGIVTTPFSYEGKKRMAQADEGVNRLKDYVDTLLIISNDKLRQKFGDLKFKAAFEKADNVLATAAKCITDVINSTGQINVDFADVCTVMRNGGVAILGAAVAEGEGRAQRAIEEALTSPLLNDNDIRGAKWILINISSAEGEFEHTLDEMDAIQAYVQSQAGEDCDVILGVGYDHTLDRNLGVTIIATGFEQKPIQQVKLPQDAVVEQPKIVMELGRDGDEKKMSNKTAATVVEPTDHMAPRLVEPVVTQPITTYTPPAQPERQNYTLNIEPLSTPPPVQSTGNINVIQPVAKPSQMHIEPVPPADDSASMKMVYRDEDQLPTEMHPEAPHPQLHYFDEQMEEQKRKQAERVAKLRSISFNVKGIDNTTELENVPAYIRRNIDLDNGSGSAESFYSNYTVTDSHNNQAEINTINTFLDGKKPD
jgi:cell division protein FtsZ